jgi:catechol 2,3-dioxygenase-like lactoylglutathione lyase family enzyme
VIVGLDHVQVAAPPGCEDDARRFYGELLGLEELRKPALLEKRGGAWFRAGAHELHVGVSDEFEATTKAHPAFRVDTADELERLAARLQEQGIEVAWADPAEIPGTTRFHVRDPWGNRLELVAS